MKNFISTCILLKCNHPSACSANGFVFRVLSLNLHVIHAFGSELGREKEAGTELEWGTPTQTLGQ